MAAKIKYKMICGCVVTKDQLKITGAGYFCKKHNENIDFRIITCNDCGIEFEFNRTGRPRIRCEKCNIAHEKARRRAWNQKRKKLGIISTPAKNLGGRPIGVKNKPIGESVRVQYDKRGDYCRAVKTCNYSIILKCDGCLAFWPLFPGVDPGKSIFC